MNAKDLMIGDWVIRRGISEEHMRLYDMKVSACIAYLDQDGRGVTEKFENIEPIPITEEILKKNFPEYESGYEIGWWPTEDGKYHIELSRDKMEVDMEYGIDYVHELQHLLKLCKIEKEIIL